MAEENSCVGIFGLSIRTREADLEDEFGKCGRVDNVVIVYDQRVRVVTLVSVRDRAAAKLATQRSQRTGRLS